MKTIKYLSILLLIISCKDDFEGPSLNDVFGPFELRQDFTNSALFVKSCLNSKGPNTSFNEGPSKSSLHEIISSKIDKYFIVFIFKSLC